MSTERRRGVAEWVSDAVGSNTFLVLNVVWFTLWIVANVGAFGVTPFDPYPFSFLTLVVSLEAIVLSVFVLIAQNRAERVNTERAQDDLEIDLQTEREITKVLAMMKLLLEKQGVDLSGDAELADMLLPQKAAFRQQQENASSAS